MSSERLALGEDSATAAVPHRHKRVDRVGTLEREPAFSNVFDGRDGYDHSLRGEKCSNEAGRYAFRCRPWESFFFFAECAEGRSPIIMKVLFHMDKIQSKQKYTDDEVKHMMQARAIPVG